MDNQFDVRACILVTAFIPVDRVVTMRGKVVSEVPTQVVQPLDDRDRAIDRGAGG